MGGNEVAGEFEMLVIEPFALDPGALNAHQGLVRLEPIAKFAVAQVEQISLVTKAQAVKASRLFLQGRLPDGVPR